VNLGRVCFPLLGNHRFPINGWALVHLGGIRVFIVAATIVFQWRMGKHRGVSRGELIAAFAEAAIPTEIPAAVYDYYKKGVIFKNFSVPLIRVIAMSMYCMKGMKTSMMMHSISCENSGWSYRLNLFCGKGVSDHLKTYILERLPTALGCLFGVRHSGIAGNGSIHRL
jgi:hypothetical protein